MLVSMLFVSLILFVLLKGQVRSMGDEKKPKEEKTIIYEEKIILSPSSKYTGSCC